MKKRVQNLLKAAVMLGLTSTLMVSCGKKNTTGGGGSDSGIYDVYTQTYAGAQGMNLPSNWFEIIAQENPCQQGGRRAQVQIPVDVNVNAGGLYVGVTSYGDVSVIHNQGGRPVMDLHICPRAGLTGQGQLTQHPVLNNSRVCPIGEITAGDVVLYGQQVHYQLKFAPIHIPNGGRYSRLCQQQ